MGVFLWQKWRDFQLWWSSGTAAATERTVLSNYIVIRQTTNISFRNHIIPQFDILIKSWTIIRLQVFDIIPLLIRTRWSLNNHCSDRSWQKKRLIQLALTRLTWLIHTSFLPSNWNLDLNSKITIFGLKMMVKSGLEKWSKMPMFQRVGMRERGGPLLLAFLYLILLI